MQRRKHRPSRSFAAPSTAVLRPSSQAIEHVSFASASIGRKRLQQQRPAAVRTDWHPHRNVLLSSPRTLAHQSSSLRPAVRVKQRSSRDPYHPRLELSDLLHDKQPTVPSVRQLFRGTGHILECGVSRDALNSTEGVTVNRLGRCTCLLSAAKTRESHPSPSAGQPSQSVLRISAPS